MSIVNPTDQQLKQNLAKPGLRPIQISIAAKPTTQDFEELARLVLRAAMTQVGAKLPINLLIHVRSEGHEKIVKTLVAPTTPPEAVPPK